MKIKVRKVTYDLNHDEVEALRKQLTPTKFVALNERGEVVARGDRVTFVEDEKENGLYMSLGDESWSFFGPDNYVIVTQEQYAALSVARLAK
jgi:membrane protein implicated in regulation of membrane protease activity